MAQEKNDWALATTRVCVKFITTGNIGWLMVFAPVVIVLVKYSYSEVRQLVDDIFSSSLFAIGGWILFVLALVIGYVMFKLQARLYERRISEMANERADLFKQLGVSTQTSAPRDSLL